MELFGDKLVCTHLEDNNMVYNEDLHILPFDGKADFVRAAEQIKEHNYKGCLTLEVFKNPICYSDYTSEAFLKRAYDSVCRLRSMIDGQ